jgi:hypothetical protein
MKSSTSRPSIETVIPTKNVWNTSTLFSSLVPTNSNPKTTLFTGTNQPTTYLTQCIKVLLGELKVAQLVKKFPDYYGNRMFITVFTTARQLSLSWAKCIQLHIFPPYFPKTHSNIILPSTPRSSELCLPFQRGYCSIICSNKCKLKFRNFAIMYTFCKDKVVPVR